MKEFPKHGKEFWGLWHVLGPESDGLSQSQMISRAKSMLEYVCTSDMAMTYQRALESTPEMIAIAAIL